MKSQDPYFKNIAIYESLGDDYLSTIPDHGEEIRDFIRIIGKKGRVLDVGCADGQAARIFQEHGFETIGIDLTDGFLERAKEKVPQAQFLKMDARRTDFPARHFSAIWANAILVHVGKKDIRRTLDNYHRILETGGKIFITVRRGSGEKPMADKFSKNGTRFFALYYKREIEDLLQDAGFRIFSSCIRKKKTSHDLEWVVLTAEKK